MKKFISLLLVIILAVGGYFFATPYLTLNNMKNAFDNKDYQTVVNYIDFPSVRYSIKQQLFSGAMQELEASSDMENLADNIRDLMVYEDDSEKPENNKDDSEELVMVFVMGIIDKKVDEYITAENMQLSLETEQFDLAKLGKLITFLTSNKKTSELTNTRTKEKVNVEYKTQYLSLNEFAVDLTFTQFPNLDTRLIMQREGLNWKIKDIILP